MTITPLSPEAQPATSNMTSEPTKNKRKQKRTKQKRKRVVPSACSQGVVISAVYPNKINCAEMTKRLKSGVDLDSIGAKVTEMSYMKSGAIAVKVGKGAGAAEAADKLRVAVEAVLGANAGVTVSSNSLHLQALGISRDDDPTDVKEGLERGGMPPAQIGFKWMKPIRRGNQMATMEIHEHA